VDHKFPPSPKKHKKITVTKVAANTFTKVSFQLNVSLFGIHNQGL
jgi:hypothetical protein